MTEGVSMNARETVEWQPWISAQWLADLLQVPGYTRRIEREWSYSEKVYQLLSDYMAK